MKYLHSILLSQTMRKSAGGYASGERLGWVRSLALAFLFTWLVSRATNRSLDRIDMVGALKSPE